MFILIPWRPVVAIWLLLSGMVLTGYVASRLMERRPLFTPYTLHQGHIHRRSAHKPAGARPLGVVPAFSTDLAIRTSGI